MATRDADGMDRYDVRWRIEGRGPVQQGTLYGLHEQEIAFARQSIEHRAHRGDTITIKVL